MPDAEDTVPQGREDHVAAAGEVVRGFAAGRFADDFRVCDREPGLQRSALEGEAEGGAHGAGVTVGSDKPRVRLVDEVPVGTAYTALDVVRVLGARDEVDAVLDGAAEFPETVFECVFDLPLGAGDGVRVLHSGESVESDAPDGAFVGVVVHLIEVVPCIDEGFRDTDSVQQFQDAGPKDGGP